MNTSIQLNIRPVGNGHEIDSSHLRYAGVLIATISKYIAQEEGIYFSSDDSSWWGTDGQPNSTEEVRVIATIRTVFPDRDLQNLVRAIFQRDWAKAIAYGLIVICRLVAGELPREDVDRLGDIFAVATGTTQSVLDVEFMAYIHDNSEVELLAKKGLSIAQSRTNEFVRDVTYIRRLLNVEVE